MKQQKMQDHLIRCPKCGAEYTPSEIYIPSDFMRCDVDISKDTESGKILYMDEDPMNTTEYYICHYCDTPFSVFTKVKFVTSISKSFDFDKDYVSSMRKKTLILSEE